ncbi:MAG: hypothetical protein ACXW5U_24645 [Thermoanaerobaculia bacterium]
MKVRPSGQRAAFFERQTIPGWAELEVFNAGTITKSESYIRELEKLGLSVVAIGALEMSAKIDESTGYRLVLLQIKDNQAVARELRQLAQLDPDLRGLLRDPGLRIVTSVEQVFDHAVADKIQAGAKANATLTKLKGADLQLNVGGNIQRDTTVKLSDGMVVAYRFARLCWSPDLTTLQLRRDVDGKDRCPEGMLDHATFDTQVAMPHGEALQNINWSFGDTGPRDCPDEYERIGTSCGTRKCVMEKAVASARAGDCDSAYSLTLLTQCHNHGAQQSLVQAGRVAVCNYLRAR